MSADPAAIARERYARVQAAMERRGVGALLLATPHLASFASGARRVQTAGGGGGLPWAVVAAGASAAVIFTPDPDGAPPWMPRDAVEPLRWDRDAHLGRLSALLAPTHGPIACDVFAPAVAALATALGRELVDAAPLLAEAMAGRSRRETALAASALAAARAALRAARAGLAPGATPAACVARFAEAMAEHGAGFPLSEGLFWRVGKTFASLALDAALGAGEVVALEMGLVVHGQAGVAGDTAAVDGRDLSAARRGWAEALCALAKTCRPGRTTGDLRAAARAAGAGQARLLAHGLGVGIEPPYVDLEADGEEPLRAGTVLVLAPTVGGFRATRALVVTDAAPRWLEPAP